MSRRTTLFVDNVSPYTVAKDLGYEFERFGRLVRCDIPSSKRGRGGAAFAFIEFEDERDAQDAYERMHGKKVDGYPLRVEWAKQGPARGWRHGSPPPRPRGGRSRSRSRSPRSRRDRSRSRSASPAKRDRSRSRSASPRRSPAPADDAKRDGDAAAPAEGQASPSR